MLAELFWWCNIYYSRRKRTIYFSAAVDSDGPAYTSFIHSYEKSVWARAIARSCSINARHPSVKTGLRSRRAYSIRFVLIEGIHCPPKPLNWVRLETVLPRLFEVRRWSATLRKSLLGCARAFEETYLVSYVDMCILLIVNDMMYSIFLAANYGVSDVRYIKVDIMMLNHQETLSLFANQGKNATAGMNWRVTQFDD